MKNALHTLLIISLMILISPIMQISATEETHEIKFISKLDLSEYFDDYAGAKIHENQLWVLGINRLRDRANNMVLHSFDISDLENLKITASYEFNQLLYGLGFFKHYAYVFSRDAIQKRENINLLIFDLSDNGNAKLVNTIEFPHAIGNIISIDDQYLVISGLDIGSITKAKIYTLSLEDPENPEIVSDTFIDGRTSEELEYFQIIGSPGFRIGQRDDYISGIVGNHFALFQETDKGIEFIGAGRTPFQYPRAIAYAGEAIPHETNHFYVVGSIGSDIIPIETQGSHYERQIERTHGITIFEHRHGSFFRWPMGDEIQPPHPVYTYSMPINPTSVLCDKTLAFVFGYEDYERPDPMRGQAHDIHKKQPSKILIIDFKHIADPKIVGEYNLNSPVNSTIQHDNIAFLFKANNELEIVELPKSDEHFRRSFHYPDREPVKEPEKVIENTIRAQIEKTDGELSTQDYEKVSSIRLSGPNITNIEKLKLLTNLEHLRISSTALEDISPIRNMQNLKRLQLTTGNVNDLKPLENLTNLEELSLGYMLAQDYSVISSLTDLKKIELSGVNLPDLSMLSELGKLEELKVTVSNVEDLSAVSQLTNLKSLEFQSTNISDISPISNLENLERLFMFNNQISDISALSNLRDLTSVVMKGNLISDITTLSNMNNLTRLTLSYNEIEDISPLSSLENLESLNLERNKITNLKPIIGLKSLTSVNLSSNKIDDISPLLETRRDEPCRIDLNENPVSYNVLLENRKKLIDNGWILSLNRYEHTAMRNLSGIALKAFKLKEESPDGIYPTFEEIKEIGWFEQHPFERLFPGYELAFYHVAPPIKLPDGTEVESTLTIVIRPVHDSK